MSLKIVYLDDEPELCEIFSDSLASDEVDIKTYVDVAEAIKEIQTNLPDIIFLDYRLPNTNGDLVAQQIAKEIPIMLITGDLAVKTSYPFQKVFQKPVNFSEIREFLKVLGPGSKN